VSLSEQPVLPAIEEQHRKGCPSLPEASAAADIEAVEEPAVLEEPAADIEGI
jgi:hypothetical protein